MAQFPSNTSASGIWRLNEVRNAIIGSNWPPTYVQKGLTAGDPAVSASEVYTSGGGTAPNGVYYIQNIYTGNAVKQCYCRLNVNGLHYQRWSLMDLTGYLDNGNYGSTGTSSEADNATIASDSSGTTTGWYKDTGTSTNAGGSVTYNTGLQLSGVANHYWLLYQYINSQGGGGWNSNGGLDWGASASGGNWGSNYVPEIYYPLQANGSNAVGTHKLGRAVWTSTSCTTTYVFSTSSYADAWTKAGNWSANSASPTGTSSVTGITTTNYIGVRLSAWSDDGNNGRSYYAYWVYIP